MSLLFNERRLRPGWRVLLFFSMLRLMGGITLFPVVALLLTTWFMTRFVDRRPLVSVGLVLDRALPGQVFLGAALGAGLMGLVVVLIGWLGGVQIQSGHLEGGAFSVLLYYFVVHLNYAVLEELLARGYLLQTLIEGVGTVPALLISALGFALLHFDNPNLNPVGLINLGLAGLFLGLLVLKTKSLWPAIGLHFAWNLTQGHLLGLPVSGIVLNEYWLQVVLEGPTWLSGGEFGPEGSVLTSAVLLGATLWAWRSPQLKPSPRAGRLWKTHVHPYGPRLPNEDLFFPNG